MSWYVGGRASPKAQFRFLHRDYFKAKTSNVLWTGNVSDAAVFVSPEHALDTLGELEQLSFYFPKVLTEQEAIQIAIAPAPLWPWQ